MRNRYTNLRHVSYRDRRIVRETAIGVLLFATSGILLVAMFGGAIYCDFDTDAVKGQCLQSIYNALLQ